MPLFKIQEIDFQSPTRFHQVTLNAWALMMWPNDETTRATFVASSIVHEARIWNRGLGYDGKLNIVFERDDVYITDPHRMIEQATEPVLEGSKKAPNARSLPGPSVAANILLQAFEFQNAGMSDISLTACIGRQSEILTTKERSKGATPKALKVVWHEYRTVAHINAAFMMVDARHQGTEGWMHNPFDFFNFIRVSNYFLRRGESIKDRRAQDPILRPGEGWEFVVSPSAVLAPNRGQNFSIGSGS